MQLFMTDPKTGTPSVSLSMLMLSFVAVLAASVCHMTGLVESTSSLTELFYACAGLYFGRRFQGKSGSVIESSTEASK